MINNVEDLKTTIADYRDMVEKAESIADGWNFTADYIEYDEKTGTIDVYGSECCKGENYHESYSFPIEWMFMTPEQLADAKAEKKKQEELARQKYEKEKAEREALEKEQKDKAEYERLKAKYEGECLK